MLQSPPYHRLSYDELVFQLQQARLEILELEEKLEQVELWQKNYEASERKISVNLELLYYECKFMLQHGDRFANFVVRDGKLCRIETFPPK